MRHFFDIGANIGQTFDDYLLKGDGFDGATIWCFEPSPRHLSQLRERLYDFAIDQNHKWKINLCPFGLGERNTWRPIHEKEDPRGDSFYADLYLGEKHIVDRSDARIGVICPVVDVVDFISGNIIYPDTVAIKIDAEGSEFAILERILGAPDIHRNIEKVIVEWHGIGGEWVKEEDKKSIQQKLRNAGIIEEGWPY